MNGIEKYIESSSLSEDCLVIKYLWWKMNTYYDKAHLQHKTLSALCKYICTQLGLTRKLIYDMKSCVLKEKSPIILKRGKHIKA